MDLEAPSKLAIFDLDGTLTSTNSVDSQAFVQAMADEFGVVIDSDWSAYQHCTDTGIAVESLMAHFNRQPSSEEIARLQRRFERLLRGRLDRQPHLFSSIPGAAELLLRLPSLGWKVCIATGAWSFSAKLKLEAAALPLTIPVFSSDLNPSREVILASAIETSLRTSRCNAFERIVSVGDGVWDVAAAARLGIGFLGVGSGLQAERLRRAGAPHVVPDYLDLAGVAALLDASRVPFPTG